MDTADGTRSLQFVFLLFLVVTIHDFVACQGICRPYGIDEVSECTSGFSTTFHIDVVEGQAKLRRHEGRQVLIPKMYFSCAGRLTKWIFPAEWEGNSQAYTELQIWRKVHVNGSVYQKVEATTIRVMNESSNKIYEYSVDPPLEFLDGDIVGYFQPKKRDSQLDIYLESSDKIYTFHDNTDDALVSLTTTFDLESPHIIGNNYPLIGAETDPPNCGCGLVTIERMNALLTVGSFMRDTFPQEQVIFPDIKFTCNGEVVKWIVGAKYDRKKNRVYYPEVQIWRPTGHSTYQKLNGTTIIPVAERRSRIYEFSVDPPLPVQPGDVLGVFQPSKDNSKLLVDYDIEYNMRNLYFELEHDQVEPSHTFINTNSEEWMNAIALPLISVKIALSVTPAVTRATSNPVTTHGQDTVLTIIDLPSVSGLSTEAMLSSLTEIFATSTSVVADTVTLTNVQTTPTPNSSPSSSVFISINSAKTGNQYGPSLYVGVVIVGVLLVLICILIIVLLAILCNPRKKKNPVITSFNSSSGHYEVCRDVTDGQPTPEPSIASPEPTFDDPIYNAPTPNIPPESSPSHSAVAYAVADIHASSTKGHTSTTNRLPSVIYDSPET